MHMMIAVIVYAPSEQEGLARGREVLDGLCGEGGKPFDYYCTFDEDTPTAGKARWGDHKPVMWALGPEGLHFIGQRMEATKAELMENLGKIRDGLAQLTDEDIYNNVNKGEEIHLKAHFLRYLLSKAGAGDGPGIFLYDNDGAGIENPGHLENALGKWESLYKDKEGGNPHKDMEVWVVPADVHY